MVSPGTLFWFFSGKKKNPVPSKEVHTLFHICIVLHFFVCFSGSSTSQFDERT